MIAKTIRTCFPIAAAAVSDKAEEINKLNVFPVPDGDTGTNMSLTLASVTKELSALPADADMEAIAGSIDVVGSDVKQVTLDCINRMQEEEEGDALTILAGEELSDEAFQEIVDAIEEAQPELEIDAHRGEQPLYPVIFSIE